MSAEASNQNDIVEALLAIDTEANDLVVDDGDLSALLDAEKTEEAGQWFSFPNMRGVSVHIAPLRMAFDSKAKLEKEYRSRKGLRVDDPLPAEVEKRLWDDSLFGSVVLGWKGMKKAGLVLPLNVANFREAMKAHRFRKFVLEHATSLQKKQEAVEESLGKA